MKFGAFIVTFNRPAILKKSIECLLEQTRTPDLIVVVDNGTSEDTKLVAQGFPNEKVVYEATGANLGSAGGFAYGVKWLYERGYDWMYCGDDDNPPRTIDTLERLLEIACTADNVGVVGTVGARWDWEKGEIQRLPDEMLNGILNVDFIGQDQRFTVHRKVVETVGLPNGRLFFGYPDLEYCLRIRQAGYRLLVDGRLMWEYRAQTKRLNLEKKRSLLPRRSYSSIWRNYYTTRTYIHMMRYTFQRPELARREALKACGRILFSWARGPRYGAAFSVLQLRGVLDGYLGRLGRTVKPKPKYGENL